MGPKDKKGGKNKGQKNSELIRLLEDVSNLKMKLGDTNIQIKEEKQINDRLMAESRARTEHVQGIESKISKEEEKHAWNKERVMDAQTTVEEDTYLRMREIEDEEAELLRGTAEHDFVATQNVTLHSWLKTIVGQYELDRERREEEREVAMQTNFDIRMSMDQILRKTIRNFDSEYNQKAMVKMDAEAALAKLDNARLFAEFARREETCSSLVKKQQASFEAMMRAKVELEVMETSTLLQEQLVASLEQRCDHDAESLSRLRSDNEMLKQDIAALEADNEDNSVHAAELQQLEDEILRLQARLPQLRPRTLRFGCEVVEKALAAAENHRKAAAASVALQADAYREMQECCEVGDQDGLRFELEVGGLGLGDTQQQQQPSPLCSGPCSPSRSTFAPGLADLSLEAPLPPEVLRADPTAIWSSTVGNDAHLRNTALRGALRTKRLERTLQLNPAQQAGATVGPGVGVAPAAAGAGLGRRARGVDNIVSLTSTSYSFY